MAQNSPQQPLYLINRYTTHGPLRITFHFIQNYLKFDSVLQAGTVAKALLDIFLVIAPPAILQSDNGREFSGIMSKRPELTEDDDAEVSAPVFLLWIMWRSPVADVVSLPQIRLILMLRRWYCWSWSFAARIVCSLVLMDIKICEIVADLWPGCRMVTGSARHSPSNGSIERFNMTIQAKVSPTRVAWSYVCWYVQRTFSFLSVVDADLARG